MEKSLYLPLMIETDFPIFDSDLFHDFPIEIHWEVKHQKQQL